MPKEIEAKFLNINPEDIRARLVSVGAQCEHPMRLMRRALFDYPDGRFQKGIKEGGRTQILRVRSEGHKTTITYKARSGSGYADEIETTVGSFEEMQNILKAIGLESYTYQESKRETWQYKNVEVVIDEWPWLSTYIEIEGPDEESIKSAASDLGLKWEDAKFGSVDTAYMDQYKRMKKTDSVGDLPEVRFGMPVPKFFKDRT